ncbi:axonemal dynein light chain domain-containing protein 1 [Antennarius striatus]|uniref:axonemal dynein light chain domain-containing protein 1 n=1 Tax=Antennarius striatus TaxID=241820 RepID=UPI0035B4B093
MSASLRTTSAPGSSRPDRGPDTGEIPTQSTNTQLPPVINHLIPEELLVSLASTVCSKDKLGHTDRHGRGCGIRRPDAVWYHQHGRKKYKYFLEQPTSLTGAGRDISFLCDAMVTQKKTTPLPPLTDKKDTCDTKESSVVETLVPEEYRIVKNKGLQSLDVYEDAFTVQLYDDEQKLRVFPSLRPSGRQEVIQLMRMMDDMLLKAGVDQKSEELTELSQIEGLLELVQVEQNIYNVVFHEVIRQVSVNCAERGQLLAKVRQRYQSLLERIPSCLKALHTEAVAQRAVDRRLTEEIHRIRTSMQQLSMELSRIRDQEAFVSQQAKHAHQRLAEALEQTHTNSDVMQGYHELYELQRGRLEAQLLQLTEERDYWSQVTFSLALKVISVKKLQLVSQLHVIKQSWSKTAEHVVLHLTSKDTADMNSIVEFTDQWKEHLMTFMSQMKKSEHAQCEQLGVIQRGIAKWLDFCTTQNKCSDPKYEKTSLEEIHTDLKEWSDTMALLCERYQGEKLLCCQETLGKLDRVQKTWLNMSFQLFRRHPSPDGDPPAGQQDVRELDQVLSEIFKHLDMRVSGEDGTHRQISSLHGMMESWVSKLGKLIGQPEKLSASDWPKLETTLCSWQSLTEKALQNVSHLQTEDGKDKNEPDTPIEIENAFKQVQKFITNLSSFTDGESQRLGEEVGSIHMAQTRWMLELLLLMVPDHDQKPDQGHHISLQTLDDSAKMLAGKLNNFSTYITSSIKLILEEQVLQNVNETENEHKMNECKKLQRECIDWEQACITLLLRLKADRLADTSSCDVLASAADRLNTLDTVEQHEIDREASQEQVTVPESPSVQLIGFDGNIVQKSLGEKKIHLNGTEVLVVSPVTDGAQRAFSDLTTVGLLQQELHDSELRVQSAEQRASEAEDALQAAMHKICDLERQLQGRPSLERASTEEMKEASPLPPQPVTPQAPPKKTTAEAKPTSSIKKTKKCSSDI